MECLGVFFYVCMPAKLTKEKFIEKAKSIHGDKFSYEHLVYKNMSTKITVTCPIHGDFRTRPYNFIYNASGCKECAREGNKRIIFGFGINDLPKESKTYSYIVWRSMIVRCYSDRELKKHPSYNGCSVCGEWAYYSNFKKWFTETYIDGYTLDKDIIKKGNKVYCPEYCCWVPQRINVLLTNRRLHRGNYPIGVNALCADKYVSMYNVDGHLRKIGIFETEKDAFEAYKGAKEAYIKKVAQEYFDKGLISERVRNALFRYEVEITD